MEKTYQSICQKIIFEAGKLLKENLGNAKICKRKKGQDICTDIDLTVEEMIVNNLKLSFPKYNIFSEEIGKINKNSRYTWLIDPLDGTKNFIRKLPIYDISIGLQKDDEIIFGMVYIPETSELFFAHKGKGSYMIKGLHEKFVEQEHIIKLGVSNTNELKNSFIHLELPTALTENLDNRIKDTCSLIKSIYRIRSLGTSAIALCYLAIGAYEGYIDFSGTTKLVDVAAGSLIVKEAGGKVTDSNGNIFTPKSKHLIASNALIHQEILNKITG